MSNIVQTLDEKYISSNDPSVYDWRGAVVSVDDPERAGRVQVRVYGKHDDKVNIPDADLPWMRCIYPVTHAMAGGVTGPTTGMVVGTIVVGTWTDAYEQEGIIKGVLGRAIASDGSRGDFPSANSGDDTNDVLKVSLTEKEKENLKSVDGETIANVEYVGQTIDDSSNDSTIKGVLGGIKKVKNTIRAVNDIKNAVRGLKDPLQIASIINGISAENGIPISIGPNGEINTSAAPLIGSIVDGIGAVDLLNRINGARFAMASTVNSVEGAFSSIKSLVKGKRDLITDLSRSIKDVNYVIEDVDQFING